MAKRLTMTYKDEVTTYDPIDVPYNAYSQINFQNVLRKLAHYEDLEEQCIKETTFSLRLILDKFIEFQNDIEELIRYRELEEQGRLIELPCAVGDTVYLRTCCEIVCMSHDYESGTSECPFEFDCEFEECSNSNERVFRTTIQSIWNDGFGWAFTVRGLYADFSINDIGRYVFLTKEEAEAKLKERGEQE